MACLTELTAGNTIRTSGINWLTQHDDTLRQIQTALNNKPFLQLPDLSRPFAIFTDSSSFAVACCLCQEMEGEYLPVRFISRRLTPAEMRYAILDLEALALVVAVSKFCMYLLGRPFVIFTNHKGLSIIQSGNTPSSRCIHRWRMFWRNISSRFGVYHQDRMFWLTGYPIIQNQWDRIIMCRLSAFQNVNFWILDTKFHSTCRKVCWPVTFLARTWMATSHTISV